MRISMGEPEATKPETKGGKTRLSHSGGFWRKTKASWRAAADTWLYLGAAVLLPLILASCAAILMLIKEVRGWGSVEALELLASSAFVWTVFMPILLVGWVLPAWLTVGFPLSLLGTRWSGGINKWAWGLFGALQGAVLLGLWVCAGVGCIAVVDLQHWLVFTPLDSTASIDPVFANCSRHGLVLYLATMFPVCMTTGALLKIRINRESTRHTA